MAYKFNPFTGKLDNTGSFADSDSAGGSNTQIQYNKNGALAGDADLTWNDSTNVLTAVGDIVLDDAVAGFTTTLQTVTPTANRVVSIPNNSGTLALVAGSSTQVQVNVSGANAGDSGLLYDATTGKLTVGGKTVTTSNPVIDLSQTWNASGTTFTGMRLNVTNTASAVASNLLDLQVNATSLFRFSPNQGGGYGTLDIRGSTQGWGAINCDGTNILQFFSVSSGAQPLRVAASGGLALGSAGDCVLIRDAANTLAQRNGGTSSVPVPQTYRIYNYYASATDYERGKLEWTSNVFRIGTEKGTSGTARALEFQTDGTTRVTVAADGSKATFTGDVDLASAKVYKINNTQVVAARVTGWGAPTGTATRTTFATYAGQDVSATYTEAEVQAIDDHVKVLSERLKALIDDLTTHGLIGA